MLSLIFCLQYQGQLSLTFNRLNLLDEDDCRGQYKPICKYGQGGPPAMSCSESIRACADGLGFSLVNECLKEVGMLSESILGNQEVQDLLLSTSIKVISEWPMLVAAIVMYTFDLCLIRPPDSFDPTTNFYYLLNKDKI